MFRFLKKKYKLESENLAVPEIHTDEQAKCEKVNDEHEIEYENLAVPEIHPAKFKTNIKDKK